MILFVVGVISLKYTLEGEDNLPFNLSRISIISTVEGKDIEDNANKWNLEICQNNDVYLYISKNENYKETEAIKSIKLDNFEINKYSNVGKIKLFNSDNNSDNVIFKNIDDNETQYIEYNGDINSDIKAKKISNQGGLLTFRYAITEIQNYISNEDEEINHSELLNKLNINNDDLKFNSTFDIYINLVSGKSYKATINLDFPINDVVKDGTQSVEHTELSDIIFKRI